MCRGRVKRARFMSLKHKRRHRAVLCREFRAACIRTPETVASPQSNRSPAESDKAAWRKRHEDWLKPLCRGGTFLQTVSVYSSVRR